MRNHRRSITHWTAPLAPLLVLTSMRVAHAQAQTAPPTTGQPLDASYQTWTSITAQGPIAGPLLAYIDVHARFYEDFQPFNVLIRPAIGVKLGHGFSAFLGYGYTPIWSTDHVLSNEHRIWEQIVYEAPFKSVKLSSRSRFEERFREDGNVGARFRELVRANIPLGLPIPIESVIWDELFIGLNHVDKWQPEIFDQNRIFLGVGWVPKPSFRLDVGYLNQTLPRAAVLTSHHALSVNAAVKW